MPSVPQSNGITRDVHTDGQNGSAASAEILEFSGSSNDTIGEAVRHAMARASRTLPTLDGVGVRVIQQMALDENAPRFRVTLRVTAAPATPRSHTTLTTA